MKSFVLERIVNADEEILTLAEIKQHLHVFASQTSDDTRLTEMISGAREFVQRYTGRTLLEEQWRLTLGEYNNSFTNVDSDTVQGYYQGATVSRQDGSILLQRSPVTSIVSFVTTDSTGADTTIGASTYEVRKGLSKWPEVVPLIGANWGSGILKITMKAGWPDAEDVPVAFKMAMKLWVEAHYDRDKEMMPLLLDTAERTLEPERVHLSIA